MKRIVSIVLALTLMFALSACGGNESDKSKDEGTDVAMIVPGEELSEGSLDQETWNSVRTLAEENNLTSNFYTTENPSQETYLASIKTAVDDGAKFIILPGSEFETTAYAAQTTYPDISFLIIDGVPNDGNGNYATATNMISAVFAEEEAGYLAGYAAVKEGYTKLAFLGGQADPATKRYGYGFVQGAAAAAEKVEKKVDLYYNYTGTLEATDDVKKKAEELYKGGTQVIFACGGAMNNSVIKAAEKSDKDDRKVIGCDVDQSSLSETVLTSAEKNLEEAISEPMKDFADGDYVGGMAFNYAAKNDAIMLEMDNARFSKFTEDDYNSVFKKLKNGEIQLKKDTGVNSVAELAGSWVTIGE